MGKGGCCVPGCRPDPSNSRLRFPNPAKEANVFQNWLKLVSNSQLFSMAPELVYRNHRVCDRHFKKEDFNRFNRLQRFAVPEKHLPGKASGSEPPSVDKSIDLPSNVNIDEKSPYVKNYEVIKHLSDFKTLELEDICYLNSESVPSAILPQKPIKLFDDQPLEDLLVNLEGTNEDKEKADLSETSISENSSAKSSSKILKKPLFKALKGHSNDNKLLDKCRICFASLKENEVVKLDSCIGEGSVQIANILKFVLSDIDLEMYSDVVVCVKCTELLLYSYHLKKTWLATEKTLENILKDNKSLQSDDDVIVYEDMENQENVEESIEHNFDHDYATLEENAKSLNSELVPVKKKGNVEMEHNFDHNYTSVEENANSVNINSVKKVIKKGVKIPKVCEKCGKVVSDLSHHLKVHKNKETQISIDKRKMCEVCGLWLKPRGIVNHVKKHTVEPNCPICNKTYPNLYTLKRHTLNVHQKANYQCHICGKQAYGLNTLRLHLKRHSPKTAKCRICGKVLSDSSSLSRHRLLHNPENCKCHICGKKVKYKSSLDKHIQIFHMNMAKNFCDICEKPYWKKYDLVRHKIKVHGILQDKTSNV